jgi:glycosyltransferase involved in cell wall biosynthesis
MKVVIPMSSVQTGGGSKILAEIANALVERGHPTEVVVPKWSPIDYPLTCKVTRVQEITKDNIPYGDIVLANFYRGFQQAYEAWPKQCVRLCQGFEPLWVEDKNLALSTYKAEVPIISVSHWLDEQINKHIGKRSEAVVQLGVDRNVFRPLPNQNSNRKNRPKVILYIARDPKRGYKLKGYEDFVQSLEYFKRQYRDPYVVHMICTENVLPLNEPHRTFRPTNDLEMANLYREADAFVSSSWVEGFGLPPLEAMACKTPVVTTNSGGIADFCKHLFNAYIVPPKNPKALAAGMTEILTNHKLAAQFKENGMQTANKLTKGFFKKNIVHVLEQIHEKKNKRKKD